MIYRAVGNQDNLIVRQTLTNIFNFKGKLKCHNVLFERYNRNRKS